MDLENTIAAGLFLYLVKCLFGETSNMTRSVLSLRYCAQYLLAVSDSPHSDNEKLSSAWRKLHEEGEITTSAMNVLSAPYLIPLAVFIQHEWAGLKKEKTIGSEQIKDFAKYVVRSGRLHVNNYRDPNNAHLLKCCRDISFFGHDAASCSAHDRDPKQMTSAA